MAAMVCSPCRPECLLPLCWDFILLQNKFLLSAPDLLIFSLRLCADKGKQKNWKNNMVNKYIIIY